MLFFVLNIYQSVTHVSTSISQKLFKKIAFRSVALAIKTVMVYFKSFFTQIRLFNRHVPYSMEKNVYKKTVKHPFIKSEKNHCDSVKNESGRTKKLEEGWGRLLNLELNYASLFILYRYS